MKTVLLSLDNAILPTTTSARRNISMQSHENMLNDGEFCLSLVHVMLCAHWLLLFGLFLCLQWPGETWKTLEITCIINNAGSKMKSDVQAASASRSKHDLLPGVECKCECYIWEFYHPLI